MIEKIQVKIGTHTINMRPESEQLMVACVLHRELVQYIQTRQMQFTFTPMGMLYAATKFTGFEYLAGDHRQAAADLAILIELAKH
jgi:hypothetical protein